jgi:uncharacterized phage protein gp47/JayE
MYLVRRWWLLDRFGVTANGFKRKGYLDILGSMETKAKELYGEDINLSERSPLGLFLKNIAWELQEIWQLGEDVYNSGYVDTAEGISQDNVGKYIAISRKSAQKAKGTIIIEGTKGTTIPKGFIVSTEATEIMFETVEDKLIDEDGVIEIPILSTVPGLIGNVPANTITKIVNPIAEVNRAYNPEATKDGTDIEKDAEFRQRYYRSVSMGGSSTRESVEAALLNLVNVTDAFVEENETMEYIGDIPPKSLAPYVFGGENEEIARTILLSKSGGIRSYGTTEVIVKDSKDREHTIGFTRPTVKNIFVKLTITKGRGYAGDIEVIKAVLNYIGGQGEEGISYKGLKLGEDVVISKIIGATDLQGVEDISVELSLDGEIYSNSNISIDTKEIARTSFDKVVISYA